MLIEDYDNDDEAFLYERKAFKMKSLVKFRKLQQGSKSVKEYYVHLQDLVNKANIDKGHEVFMGRFLLGLNQDIADEVEFYDYATMMIYSVWSLRRRCSNNVWQHGSILSLQEILMVQGLMVQQYSRLQT
ncbi:hypothetical protein PIB30_030817 [Stylosanthes scabra]|uniref:Retrotransposon gag domain-containing protein n=1 Tax=Stylosanthes scabra TaxID=79078 RepID=A0ABU6SCI6_9FABA|nr:hypothetical protein [Stylosanthes scabra]